MRIRLFWISLHVASAVASKREPQSQRQKKVLLRYIGDVYHGCFFQNAAPEASDSFFFLNPHENLQGGRDGVETHLTLRKHITSNIFRLNKKHDFNWTNRDSPSDSSPPGGRGLQHHIGDTREEEFLQQIPGQGSIEMLSQSHIKQVVFSHGSTMVLEFSYVFLNKKSGISNFRG